MEDKSLFNESSAEIQNYLNDLAIAVCIKGDLLEKYEKLVTKRYGGSEIYSKMKLFVEEVQRSVERKKFTDTSKINLGYLGKNAGLSENTVTTIIKHFEDNFAKTEREEENFWNQCRTKEDYQRYLNRYPHGMYASDAYRKIQQAENEEKKLEEQRRKERLEKVAEQEMWIECQSQKDYERYLMKYPKGMFASDAKSKINEFEREAKEKEDEAKALHIDLVEDLQ